MILPRRSSERAVVLGLYQNPAANRPILQALWRRGFFRAAAITVKPNGTPVVSSWLHSMHLVAGASLAGAVVAGIAFSLATVRAAGPALWIQCCAVAAAGAACGWIVARLVDVLSARTASAKYGRWVLRGESLVFIAVRSEVAATVAELLSVAEGEHPAVFVLHTQGVREAPGAVLLAHSPLGEDDLRRRAVRSAADLRLVGSIEQRRPLALQHLDACERTLKAVQRRLADAVRLDQAVALPAEWLLDNAYIVQGAIEDVRRNLSPDYYRRLPRLTAGPLAGHPRVYALACELVADTDAHLTKASLQGFVQAFQSDTELTTGELWALPMMVRLRLVEWLTRLAIDIERRENEGDYAEFWGNRLLYAARREPDRMPDMLARIAARRPTPSANLADGLLGHLYDEDRALTPVRAWLATRFPAPLEDVVRVEQQQETAEQVSLANAITTLRLVGNLDWRLLFEAVSRVDAVLWADPDRIYGRMDFPTRDRYRAVVEHLSRRCHQSETEVARAAIELARASAEEPMRHVGYFLIDDGRTALEAALCVRPSLRLRVRRWTTSHPAVVYCGAIALLTAGLVFWTVRDSGLLRGPAILAPVVALLALLPASEIALQAANWSFTHILSPRALPKLAVDEPVPDDCRTLVVVPMMLLTPASIREEAARLEVRALANPDVNLLFALLSDYSDAPAQQMPEDYELRDVAVRRIEELNAQHNGGRYLLFHRERTWSETEQRWMGKERKRGKLEALNAFLLGDPELDQQLQLLVGARASLDGIRFVITLDADTQLPRDTARRLVATLAHPLNAPVLAQDGRSLRRGYSIIQPRTSTSLPSATSSLFTRLFTDPGGVDPYTHAVSDVYQDLAGWANYHGKGIYDLRAFHSIMRVRFPDAHLLSHDLIEGAFARTGLASDIELLDLFPADYGTYCAREHRWVRGDWQIADWLLPHVPGSAGEMRPNTLPALERWKILDNLRRSLVPAATVCLLVVGCAVSPSAHACAALVAALVVAPMSLQLLDRLTHPWKLDPAVWSEPALNLLRSLLFAAVMPHQAGLCLDAIARVWYRRLVSRRLYLEWTTFLASQRGSRLLRQRRLVQTMVWVPVFAIAASALVMHVHASAAYVVLPFTFVWALSPLLVALLNEPLPDRPGVAIPSADAQMLRHIARQTWRFWTEFVTEQTHWLPPDNYQVTPRAELAERTSPTNIGLYLLAVLAAHDLGYATCDQCSERLLSTLRTISGVERYRGHLLNWYDTRTLEPLGERYVSTVDSGNLMGCLWALAQGAKEMLSAPLLCHSALGGIADALALVRTASHDGRATEHSQEIDAVMRVLAAPAERLEEMVARLRELTLAADELAAAVKSAPADPDAGYWAEQVRVQVASWNAVADRYLAWVETLASPPADGMLTLGADAHALRRQALAATPSLLELVEGAVPGLAGLVAMARGDRSQPLPDPVRAWLDRIVEEAARAQWLAGEAAGAWREVLTLAETLDRGMEMRFLLDPDRRLFAVGFNVAEQRLDRSYYDLLASEARLASFAAIARGDVPVEHWWALGRPFGRDYLRRPLMSWSGTMFEYLMPLLLTRTYRNSLLDQACKTAITSQIAYAQRRGIPWGISESAYSALDSRQIYQYRAFGVPALALKRGVEQDLVVAPYATALALPVAPAAATRNMRALMRAAGLRVRGAYGFYESVDYTREHGPRGERGIVVETFMAHHQAMALVATDNALNGGIMQRRFHADPRVQATESLLFERIPIGPPVVKGEQREGPIARLAPIASVPAPGRVDTPNTATPRTHLLSNGALHAMATNAGGGYLRWRDSDLTRWRADTTRDDHGPHFYLKDLDTGAVWSAGYQPTCVLPQLYRAIFSADRAEIRRRDAAIETVTEIVISPEDNAAVYRLTLINRSARPRRIEVTSYLELALAPHATDRAHPAFNKMFIETAALLDLDALLAWRRPRSPDDPPIWTAHIIAAGRRSDEPVRFETDRYAFIGRGRTARQPAAIDGQLSGTAGYVLDPIFSLRTRVAVESGGRIQVAFTTVAADTREQAVALAAKYRDIASAQRAIDLAWTQAQLELRHLRIKPDEAQLYQQLASHVIYPHSHLRAPAERIAANTRGQNGLWAYGISGDLPIVVVTIDEAEHIDLVQDALAAHSFWHARGLKCDLMILNSEAASYDQPLHVELQRMVAARAHDTGIDQPGGVYLRPARQIPPEDMTLLLTAARVVLVAARGPLAQQIGAPVEAAVASQPRHDRQLVADEPSPDLPFMELKSFNGLGGFTNDGKEYATYLTGTAETPAPWINVIANPQFGALVSEQGNGTAWCGNSQSNKLTPWSNDPVSDPPHDAIYLYDAALDALWTPTPLPIREIDAYRARHGQGYSVHEHNSHAIEQELVTFVPTDGAGGDPIRIQRLKLTNRSARPRSISVTFYAEWVLGADKEESQLFVVTGWDLEAQALLARNAYNPDYGRRVAFAACVPFPTSFTGDRTEMLGRNGCIGNPVGARSDTLSGHTGGGLDPCAALQSRVQMAPGEQVELVFLIGEASDIGAARDLIRKYRDTGRVDAALQRTREYWDGLLGAIEVQTPDAGTNLLMNRWLLYQVLSCRVWGRSAFYQSGGAFGFRDQLQDVLALLYTAPQIAREQILLSAARQFREGDVQHWWHPQSGAGVRTRISDDLLWLPFVAAHYVRVTGDAAILDEQIPFIEGRLLDKGEREAYFVPTISEERASLLEHCRRAVARGATVGPHGLPLIGGGDWNDGFNLVGIGGKGESVWLAWFLIHVFNDMAEIAALRSAAADASEFVDQARQLAVAVEASSWDGEWYRRAYFDDGSPLGSARSPEAQIDSLSQSWAAISGAGEAGRVSQAMRSVDSQLVRAAERIVLLFTPPFDRSPQDPGYIKGYPPGVRENGGQYTHGSLWVPLALSRMGDGDRAVATLRMMSPIEHSSTLEDAQRYRVEPYVVAADIYNLAGHVGMGGWTWYSGSAGWMYRVWLEEVLGFRLRGGLLTVDPCIAAEWPGFTIRCVHGSARYNIAVENPQGVCRGVIELVHDGASVPVGAIQLADDGAEHHIRVTLGHSGGPTTGPART